MSSDLLDYLEGIILLLFIAAPLTIQLILYPLGRLCLKKIPAHVMYWICFIVDLILLVIFYESANYTTDPADIDSLGGLIMMIVWSPWIIGVLLWAIGKSVIETRSDKNEESVYDTDEAVVSED